MSKTAEKVAEYVKGFDDRRDEKLDRVEGFAANARKSAQDHRDASARAVEHIPFGQPILVGHHSEKGHRRDLERSQNHMFKSVEESARASKWDSVAAGVEKDHAIHFDDPDAAEKIKTRVAQLEARQDLMKAVNKAYKAYLKKPESLETAPLSDKMKQTVRNYKPDVIHDRPFPQYALTNNSANIRRLKKRLERIPAQLVQAVNGRWLYCLKYDGKCAECGVELKRGAVRAFYVKAERAIYCEECGKKLEAVTA